MDTEVIEERGNYRAVVIRDDYPMQPDHDGQGYVFQVSRDYYRIDVHPLHRDYGAPNETFGLSEALDRFEYDWELVERYLRMFHDVVSFDRIQPYYRDAAEIVCIVTRRDVEQWGCSEEYVPGAAADTLKTWRMYAEGDCYGYRIEERTVTEIKRLSGEVIRTDDSWLEVDSCWGYFGTEDVRESALDSLAWHADHVAVRQA